MQMNLRNGMGFKAKAASPAIESLNSDGLRVSERISEIMMMCDRAHPIYEQISSFSIALYAMGFFEAPDLMSVQDIDSQEAAAILREHFTEVRAEDIPDGYAVSKSKEKYLLVAGDPAFPVHFAMVTDIRSDRPYFSKLPFFGSGHDSLNELMADFSGREDIHYFRLDRYGEIPPSARGKIYIFK
ncbi:MAG: hypothetical protein C4518_12865 [Desulfobacteraceae bacterium]|nr:MAG: hypothetical protein C4518_12865 [Desulfobacteraceae bacterium]